MQNLANPAGAFRVGPIRPPSEANSLLLQVTNGCTWNRCRFCNIYRDTKFKAFDADSVKRDIDTIAEYAEIIRRFQRPDGSWDLNGLNERLGAIGGPREEVMTGGRLAERGLPGGRLAGIRSSDCTWPAEEGGSVCAWPAGNDGSEGYGPAGPLNVAPAEDRRQSFYMVANWLVRGGENVFLQDGNTTALSSGRLADVLVYLKQTFPQIRRITSYGRAAELSRHDADYYAELKEAGLDRIHSGFESGSDKVLTLIKKGCKADQEIAAGRAIKAGGVELSVYFMPGIGGKELSEENAVETARVINAIGPDFLRIRTAAVKPGTEMYEIFFPQAAGNPAAETAADPATETAEDEVFGPGCSHTLCSDDDKVREIRRVIELAEGIPTKIVSDHMVNLLQNIEGPMCSAQVKDPADSADHPGAAAYAKAGAAGAADFAKAGAADFAKAGAAASAGAAGAADFAKAGAADSAKAGAADSAGAAGAADSAKAGAADSAKAGAADSAKAGAADSAKAALLSRIDRYLDLPETERRIYQLLRRTLRAYDLDDMDTLLQGGLPSLRQEVSRYTEREWDEKMNAYISRYI